MAQLAGTKPHIHPADSTSRLPFEIKLSETALDMAIEAEELES